MQNLDKNIFVGDKVRLTAIRTTDLPDIQKWYEDSAFLRFYDSDPAQPCTEESLQEWIEKWDANDTQKRFIIRPLTSDTCLGHVGLDGIEWSNGACSCGIAIGDPKNRGKGYGRDAMQLILNYAFNELNLHRIGLTVFEYNISAIALYKSLGFQLEGTVRDFVHRDDQRYAMYWYGLLRPEWESFNL